MLYFARPWKGNSRLLDEEIDNWNWMVGHISGWIVRGCWLLDVQCAVRMVCLWLSDHTIQTNWWVADNDGITKVVLWWSGKLSWTVSCYFFYSYFTDRIVLVIVLYGVGIFFIFSLFSFHKLLLLSVCCLSIFVHWHLQRQLWSVSLQWPLHLGRMCTPDKPGGPMLCPYLCYQAAKQLVSL